MSMQGMQQAPKRPRSPWARYGPILAIVAVIVVVVIVIVAVTGGNDNSKDKSNVNVPNENAVSKSGENGVPLFYNDAKSSGQLDKYTWQDNCDTSRGTVSIPILTPPPCVPKFSGDNGGATAPGVTGDTIKIGYYIAKPDPLFDVALKQAGAYDPPEKTEQAAKDAAEIYGHVYETYGRKIVPVKIQGTGASNDPVAARADADSAAAKGVFAVVGGPAQAKQFSEELAKKKVVCVGTCLVAQPEKFILDNAPYIRGVGPTPDQTSTMVSELIQKQLIGKNAQYGGADVNGKPRTFTMLTYNTADGQFTSSWDDLEAKLKGIGAKIVGRVDYQLDFTKLQEDARTIAAKLKAANATTIVFTGDPIFPASLTKEMTKGNYFPEWVMSGTVFADTNVFARTFDQEQWKHAFGLQLTPVKIPKPQQDAYTLHQWWFGKDTQPATENNFAVVDADWRLLMNGIQLAGANLTPQSWTNGLDAVPPAEPPDKPVHRSLISYGRHGVWGDAYDPGGLDNAGILWWDPDTEGPDETGNVAKGVYRLVANGLRYEKGNWPSDPVPLFDKTNTVTVFTEGNVPAEFTPPSYPSPAGSPAAG
ncbi:MAG TPA: hypothetical protein VL856_11025 [Acidimicrobiia bacterium]|jgi:hypothetical protein|nr:hypothetical protein [Acidimicrobiia bacterium]